MGFTEAAYKVLKEKGKPLTAVEITKIAKERGLIETRGKTPDASLGAGIYMEIKREGNKSRFVKVERGFFCVKRVEN